MEKSRNRTTKRRKLRDKPADTEPEIVGPEWVAMIKDHGALGLSPSTCLELLEKHFGDAFRNAKIEPRGISNLYYKHG